MKKKILIFIPVYNEEKNIKKIIFSIFKNFNNRINILFMDDNSQDKTQQQIRILKKKYKNIFLHTRPKKLGIGSAHKKAFLIAKKKKYKYLVTMDCDGTHNPYYINKLFESQKKKNSEIVTTNRFLVKGSLNSWSTWRKILTWIRHLLIKVVLKINYDSSGAFRLYNLNLIKTKDFLSAKHNGYSFFWESIYLLHIKKYKISQIPIHLPGRMIGKSKMSFSDVLDALIYLIKIYFTKNAK